MCHKRRLRYLSENISPECFVVLTMALALIGLLNRLGFVKAEPTFILMILIYRFLIKRDEVFVIKKGLFGEALFLTTSHLLFWGTIKLIKLC